MTKFPIPSHVAPLLEAIQRAGGTPMIIGGAVRDFLFDGRAPKDIDVEVFGLEVSELEAVLTKTAFRVDAVGRAFGVLKVQMTEGTEQIDVSLPRRENKQGTGHRGFLVTPDPHMTYAEAAARRDFTANTVGFNPMTETFEDPFNGAKDIGDRVLRHVSDHFDEDPLRVLRGCQFVARFGFTMIPETVEKCRSLRGELKALPVERLWTEWVKLLTKSEKPSLGIDLMRETGVLEELFPELHALIGVPQDPEWHPEGQGHPLGSLWIHNQMVTDEAARIVRRDGLVDSDPEEALIVMLSAMCHDLGKPSTTEFLEERWRSRGHEKAGGPFTVSLLTRMGCSPSIIEKVVPVVENHLAPSTFFKQKASNGAIRRLALKTPLLRLVRAAEADHMGRTTPDVLAGEPYHAGAWLLEKASTLSIREEGPKPYLLGRHLLAMGFKPGPEMGTMLKQAFEAQMDDAFLDEPGAIQWAEATFGRAP